MRSTFWIGLSLAKCRKPMGTLPGCVRARVCRITLTQAKLTHRAIFTPGQGVDLLLRDFTVLSAAWTEGEGYTAGALTYTQY